MVSFLRSFLRSTDALIQSAVDAGVVWLMRRGVPRSKQLLGMAILVFALFAMQHVIMRDWFSVGAIVLIQPLCIPVLRRWYLADATAEQRGMAADITGRAFWASWWWKCFNMTAFVLFPWQYATPIMALCAAFWSTCILECYVILSPNQPPPAKQEHPVQAVPEAA